MRKRRLRLKQLLAFTLADLVGLVMGLALAYFLRFGAGIVEVTKAYSPLAYVKFLPIAAAIWIFWLDAVGCYDFRGRAFNLQILKKLFHANVLAVMTIIVLHFFQRSQEFSRLMYPLAILTCTVSTASARLVLDRVVARLRRAGRLPSTPVLVLGTGPLGLSLATRIQRHAFLGLRVVGLVSDGDALPAERIADFPVLGNFSRIRELIRLHGIEEVIVAQPGISPQQILDFVLECEKELVSVRVIPNLLEAMLVEMTVEQIDGIPLFGLKESPLQGWNLVLKRGFDIAVSLVALVLLAPLALVIAAAVKLTSPGPIFYKQKRVGLDGRRFKIVKFRSMYADAEAESGPVWATQNDHRVTPLGRWLRRMNLDEIPQLWNVLRGDMSLVGPRPERPHFVKQFRERIPRYMGRHRVKSGITGWAQVNGLRGQTSIDDRIKYDLYYIEHWSIWLDLKILLMTVTARQNAY